MGKIGKRVMFGLAMIIAVSALFYWDWWLQQQAAEWVRQGSRVILPVGMVLACLLVVLEVTAVAEVARLTAGAGVTILPVTSIAGCVAVATLPLWRGLLHGGLAQLPELLAVSLVVCLAFAEQMLRHRKDDAIRRLACTMLAVTYLGVGGALVLWLRLEHGVQALVLFLAAVKFTDIGAYFTGTAIGKHKMIPWLSPGKSWEGLAGGMATACIVSILLAPAFGLKMATWQAATFGVATGLVGQFGDLCESLLKRSASLKDSGALVPEFGGILDIIDSPLLAAPVAIVLLALFS